MNERPQENVNDQDVQLVDRLEKDAATNEDQTVESEYPPLRTVLLSMMAIYLSFFLAALDRTIIGVAIPAISNDFKSFGDIAWYEAAFLLTYCVFQFPMGKIYTYFTAKWIYVTAVVIFEIGSILCAAAPTSVCFIIGRAMTGIGGAGSQVGASVIMIDLVPLHKRPKYQGFLGAVFGLASIIGPLIGGLMTTKLSWRWCFWINLPIGGVALVMLLIFLPKSPPPTKTEGTLGQKFWNFDPVGNLVLTPGIILILLVLQWGGVEYAWNSPRIISLLVIGILLLLAFICVQGLQDNGTIPPRIVRQRSIASGVFVSIGLGAALIIPTFYLPIWHQAIKGTSAVNAGVRILPLFLGSVLAVIGCGIVISKTGYYTPWLIVGCAIQSVGGGLLTTLKVDTSTGQWIAYSIVVGIGTGMTLQQSAIAVQTVLSKKDVPIGLTIISFSQFFAGTVAVSICQTVLSHTLASELSSKLPGFDVSRIANTGATGIRTLVSESDLPTVLTAYNKGLNNVFYCSLGCSCLAFVSSLFMEWKSVKEKTDGLDEQNVSTDKA